MNEEIEPATPEIKELICPDCVEHEDEVISESFICCVCLDLLYKPIVLACGHVCCFWCVYISMNGLGGSKCPMCRHSYHHFHAICEMLHFFIVKMYPNAYHRRDIQMLEKEKEKNSFSPKFIGESAFSTVASSQSNLANEVSKLEINSSGILNSLSITDALCPKCKKLLFRPAVLNCGHALCESCITISEDEIIICSSCECQHPSDLPKVCLELNNFLEIAFPEDYVARKNSIERQQTDLQQKAHVPSSSKIYPTKDLYDWLGEHGPKVHIGTLCDYCGVYPIVGTRYRCKDCKEAMGFDLCETCYNKQSKLLPGRFNQLHMEEHEFEVRETAELARQRLIVDMQMYHLMDLSADSTNASEESQVESDRIDIFGNSQENNDDNYEDGSTELNEHLTW